MRTCFVYALALLSLAAAAAAAPPRAADIALSEAVTERTATIDCPPGSYYYGKLSGQHYCVHCMAGTFSARGCSNCSAGAKCQRCPRGTTSASGAKACAKAPTCAKGAFLDTAKGKVTCSACAIGRFKSKAGSAKCSKCAMGSYQPRLGMSGCYSCPSGEYADAQGLQWCKKCDKCAGGRFGVTNARASKSASACGCAPCAVGRYVTKGYTKCYDCPAGRFNFKTAQQGCYHCAAGQFQRKTGQAKCQPCPAGRFQPVGGQRTCQSCPAGLLSVGGADKCTKTGRENFRAFFGIGDSTTAPPAGWKMLTVLQLNQFAESMRHFYELNGGFTRIGFWASSACCLATPGGKRLWTGSSATSGSFVFPASAGKQADLRCNPTTGYTDATYRIYGQLKGAQAGVHMSTATKFFEADATGICASSGRNPALFMRLEPTALPCTERSVDYGKWRVCITPPAVAPKDQRTVRFRLFDASRQVAGYSPATRGWKLMTIRDVSLYKSLLLANMQQRGGIAALKGWTAKGCCVTLAGDYKLTADNGSGKHSYVFPTRDSAVACGKATTYAADKTTALSFMSPVKGNAARLAALADASALRATRGDGMCAHRAGDRSPGIYMAEAVGVAEGAFCEVVEGKYLCVEPPSTVPVVACELSAWGSWSKCSASCAGGGQLRKRALTKGSAKQCGSTLQTRICATHACPVDCIHHKHWAAWSACSKTCGSGALTRTRDIMTPAGHGGLQCEEQKQTMPCTAKLYCPVACKISQWGAWGRCSKACGGGKRTRYRTELAPANHGGRPCPAPFEAGVCNAIKCPVDCKVSSWSSWGVCSATCGSGVNTRKRAVLSALLFGGKSCGQLEETRVCTHHALLAVCPVDCKVSPQWSKWEACTRSCGGGLMVSRKAVLQQPSSRGAKCPAASALVRSKVCNTHPCKMSICHAEHVRCHYDHHHLVISHDKRHGVFGKFKCSSKAGYRAPKNEHLVRTSNLAADANPDTQQFDLRKGIDVFNDPCKMVKKNLGGECTPLRQFTQTGKHAGHVYGFRLGAMKGLAIDGFTLSPKTAVAESSQAFVNAARNQAIKNACKYAMGRLTARKKALAKATWSSKSFGIASGPKLPFWRSDAHKFSGNAGWNFAKDPRKTKALTYLQCLFTSAELFSAETPKKSDSCVCTCTEHPCCSTKGWALANPELEGNHFAMDKKEQCCNACTNHPNCSAWTFDAATKVCSLHGGRPDWVRAAASSSTGTRSQGGSCRQ